MVKTKKIWLNYKKTKYCKVKVFEKHVEMLDFYRKHCDKFGLPDEVNTYVKGASIHYAKILKRKCLPETGIVILNLENATPGIVAHEFLHAVLWARKHGPRKRQYPIVINTMEQEEELLHNHTYALDQFYKWYWKNIA